MPTSAVEHGHPPELGEFDPAAGLIHLELLGVREAKGIVLEFFAIHGVSRPTREEVLKGLIEVA
jgi:hypothetical protein